METIIAFFKGVGPDWFVAFFTLGLLIYNIKLLRATNKTIENNKQFYNAQLRAYLSIVDLNLYNKRTYMEVSFIIKNFGKTFAKDINFSIYLNYSKQTKKTEYNKNLILFPTSIHKTYSQIDAIFEHSSYHNLIINIEITYFDVFNVKHFNKSTYQFKPSESSYNSDSEHVDGEWISNSDNEIT